MKPNPLSISKRAIVPLGIPDPSAAESGETTPPDRSTLVIRGQSRPGLKRSQGREIGVRTPSSRGLSLPALNLTLWVLQVLAALLYGASGVMKVFMFDQISGDVPSFGALPREAWTALGILELICAAGLVIPSALRWRPVLTVAAATLLSIESLVFIGVHVKYREAAPIIMSVVLGLLMAFVAYGRSVLKPIL